MITGAAVAVAFVIYIRNYVDPSFDELDNLKFDSALSTTMYYVDRNGSEVLLENDTLQSSENRMWATYQEIPKTLIDAYIAVEDQRFLEHNGVDTTRTASAIYNFFIPTSSNYGGGSTITQQLIKNVTEDNRLWMHEALLMV
jgi:penicillin-binding protein 1A